MGDAGKEGSETEIKGFCNVERYRIRIVTIALAIIQLCGAGYTMKRSITMETVQQTFP